MILGPEHHEALREIIEVYSERLLKQAPMMLGLLVGTIALGLIGQRLLARREVARPFPIERWLRLALVLACIGVGLWLVLARAACYDDAYISLRYADNLVAGDGLVFNAGEQVEGYTNFLWTVLIAALRLVVPIETPLIAVILCLLAYVANLAIVDRLALTIAPRWHEHAFRIPLAVGLLAIQQTFVDYGTSGLETGFASLLVNLGLLALVCEPQPRTRSMFLAGLCWILATLARTDHAIFYAVGSAVVLGTWAGRTLHALRTTRTLRTVWTAGLAPMLAYAAPFVLLLGHLAWRLHYYGRLLPNTYYAKSADLTYYAQGWVYATEFHLGSHLWIALVALAAALPFAWPQQGPARRFIAFAIPAIALYEWHVVRAGGDFMAGRFYVSVLPLLLLLGELVVVRLAARCPAAALVVAGLLVSTAGGVRLIEPKTIRWNLADENSYYRIAAWSPAIVINHDNYWVGRTLGELEARGIKPVISSRMIGLVGYYSRLETIDQLGLTDATIAHLKPPKRRGRPGHEKSANLEYLHTRGVHFALGVPYPKWFAAHGKIRFGGSKHSWLILRYDRELMRAIRESGVDVEFKDLEQYLDSHLTRLPLFDPERVREEYAFLRTIYFDHQHDPHRARAYEVYIAWVDSGHDPKALLEEGRWSEWSRR